MHHFRGLRGRLVWPHRRSPQVGSVCGGTSHSGAPLCPQPPHRRLGHLEGFRNAPPTPVANTWISLFCTPKGAPAGEPADHGLGRSRGGLTMKIHLAADGRCRPLAFVLTPGQAGDSPAFTGVLAAIRVTRRKGRPRTRPVLVLADKSYSSRAIRSHLRRRGIRAVIPQPADQAANRKRLGRRGACLRPGGLQAAEHRRTLHQQAQAVARPGHPLGHSHPRIHRQACLRRQDPARSTPLSQTLRCTRNPPTHHPHHHPRPGGLTSIGASRPPPSTSPDSTSQPTSSGQRNDPKETA